MNKPTQHLKEKLILLKQTKFWYFFLMFIFLPIFDFIWVNIVNFQGRLLGLVYLFKKRDFYKIEKYEEAKLIENSPEFQKIALIVKNSINEDLINRLKEKIEAEKTNDPLQNQYANYSVSFFSLLPENVKDEILKFALLEKNIATATKYLKVLPVAKKLLVYLNVPKEGEERGAQLWRKDEFGYKSLDIFLAVSDVNINNGSLHFQKNKNKLGVFFKIKNVIKNALPGERNKVTLETFSNYFKEEEVGALIGKSGTGVFIDSFTKYHRGGFCKSENRIMLRVSYQTPDTSRGLKINDPGEFPYYPKIKKKDIKNIYHKYILFKNRNKFLTFIRIDSIILFIIKIFHYKK